MASDILITPNKGSAVTNAKIEFTGATSESSTMRIEVSPNGALSFIGSGGTAGIGIDGSISGTFGSYSSYLTMGSLVANDPGASYYGFSHRIGGTLGISQGVSIGSGGAAAPSNGLLVGGSVGIGMTTSPGAKLEIELNAASQTDGIRLKNANTGGWGHNLFFNLFDYTNSASYDVITAKTRYAGGAGGYLEFSGKDQSNSAAVSVMTLKGNGTVGIGTTSPTASGFSTGSPILDLTGTVPTLALHASGSTQQALIVSGGDGLILAASGAATATNNNVIRFYTEETNSQNTPTERVRIDSVGNVGIGTNGPGTTLQVKPASYGESYGISLLSSSNGNVVGILQDNIDEGIFRLKTGGVDKVVLRANGNSYITGKVGIGTAAPFYKVGINTSGAAGPYENSIAWHQYNNDNPFVGISFDDTNDGLSFNASVGIAGFNRQYMFINRNTGNVGIGTIAPVAKLHIGSETEVNLSVQSLFVDGAKTGYAGYAGLPQNQLLIYDSTASTAGSGGAIGFGANTGSSQRTWIASINSERDSATNDSTNYAGSLAFYTRPAQSTPTVKMRITSAGDVGIGTNPSYKLDVSGSVRAGSANQTALLVTASGTATTQAAIAIQQLTTEGDTIIFADYEPYAEYGIIARNSEDSIDFTGGTGAGSLANYNVTNRSGGTRTAYVKARIGLGSGNSFFGGNVGIGTTSTGAKLDIFKATGPQLRIYGNAVGANDAYIDFGADNAGVDTYGRIGIDVVTGTEGVETGGLFFSTISSGTLSKKVSILGNGDVGIGILTGMGSKLHVVSEISVGPDSNNRSMYGFSSGRAYFGTVNASVNYFDTLSIKNGNVGIGTIDPLTPLQVNGSVGIYNGASGNVGGVTIIPSNGDTLFTNNSPGAYGDYGMRFKTMQSTGGSQYNDALYLKYNGNVGIGTVSPNKKLVVATATAADAIVLNSTGLSFTTDKARIEIISGPLASDFGTGMQVGIEGGAGAAYDHTYLQFYTSSYPTSRAVRMHISESGVVGIGDDSPGSGGDANRKLMVNGGITVAAGSMISYDKAYYVHANSMYTDGGSEFAFRHYGYYGIGFQTRQGTAMVIRGDSNNVGIGTTSPAAKLQVEGTGVGGVGTISIKGASAHLGMLSASNVFKGWTGYFNAGAHGSDNDLNIKTGYAGTSNIRFSADGDTTAAMMIITSAGNVGIGTATPLGKLQVGATGILTDLGNSLVVHNSVDGDATIAQFINSTQATGGSTNETAQIYLGWRDAATGRAQASRIVAGKEGDYTTGAAADSFLAFYTAENNGENERVRIASNGTVTISSSTAGSAGAGALVVTGGLSAGGASYFGGAVSVTGNFTHNGLLIGTSGTTAAQYLSFNSSTGGAAYLARENSGGTAFAGQAYSLQLYTDSKPIVLAPGGVNKFQLDTSGAATFAGAVTVNGTLTNTAAQLGAFTSTTANATSGESVFSIIGANTNTSVAYGINRAPGIAIQNTSGTANSYGGLVFMDAGGNTTSSILGIFENDATNVGSLQFGTRPSGGNLTTALTLASTGAATFAGAVTVGGNVILGGRIDVTGGVSGGGLTTSHGQIGGSTNGLELIGQGVTNDVVIYNKNGSSVFVVPTGTVNMVFNGGAVSGISTLSTTGAVTVAGKLSVGSLTNATDVTSQFLSATSSATTADDKVTGIFARYGGTASGARTNTLAFQDANTADTSTFIGAVVGTRRSANIDYSGGLDFYVSNVGGVGNPAYSISTMTKALSLSYLGAATFAGAVTVTGSLSLLSARMVTTDDGTNINHTMTGRRLTVVNTGSDFAMGYNTNLTWGNDGSTLGYNGVVTASGTGTHTFGTTNTVTMAAGVLTTTGAATFAGAVTAIGSAGDSIAAQFGSSTSAQIYIRDNSINCATGYNGAETLRFNYVGYANGTTQFRNSVFHDGKAAVVATFTGSDKSATFAGALNVAGAVTANGSLLVSPGFSAASSRGVFYALQITGADTVAAAGLLFSSTNSNPVGLFSFAPNTGTLTWAARSTAGNLSGNDLFSIATTGAATFAGAVSDSIGDIRILPQNSRSAAYTTVLSDSGKHILHPSADTTARTITIDSNANVAYSIGTAITFINQNAAGELTIAITSDTMRLAGAGTTGSRTLAANGVATAVKITSTEWIISGTGLT